MCKTQQFELLIPYYRLITNEFEMRTLLRAVLLKDIRRRSIRKAILDRFQNCITRCILGSLYRAFSMQDLRQRPLRPYRRNITNEALKAFDRYLYVLLDYIHRFLPPGNSEGPWPSIVYITYPYQLGPHTLDHHQCTLQQNDVLFSTDLFQSEPQPCLVGT